MTFVCEHVAVEIKIPILFFAAVSRQLRIYVIPTMFNVTVTQPCFPTIIIISTVRNCVCEFYEELRHVLVGKIYSWEIREEVRWALVMISYSMLAREKKNKNCRKPGEPVIDPEA
jgi:hypothetical protein